MSRSVWKGPFVDVYLIKKAEAVKNSGARVGGPGMRLVPLEF